jgi:hypothetical protein
VGVHREAKEAEKVGAIPVEEVEGPEILEAGK